MVLICGCAFQENSLYVLIFLCSCLRGLLYFIFDSQPESETQTRVKERKTIFVMIGTENGTSNQICLSNGLLSIAIIDD